MKDGVDASYDLEMDPPFELTWSVHKKQRHGNSGIMNGCTDSQFRDISLPTLLAFCGWRARRQTSEAWH